MTETDTKNDPGINYNTMAANYRAYADAGLSVFPVHIEVAESGGKVGPPSGHDKYSINIPSKLEIESWTRPGHSQAQAFGMAMGKIYDGIHRIVCLDIDNPALVRAIKYLCPSTCGRFGSKGVGLFYKIARDDKLLTNTKNLAKNFHNPVTGEVYVEFITTGRFTFIPPSIHRKTGQRYTWTDKPLLESLDSLTLFTHKDLRIIEAIVKFNAGGFTVDNITSGHDTHNPLVSFTASLVARGIDPEKVKEIARLLLPEDYKGDELDKIPEMVDSAARKGLGKSSGTKLTSADATEEDFANIFQDWHYIKNINRMFNTTTLDTLDKERFESIMGKVARRAWSIYMQWEGNSIKNTLTYQPGMGEVLDDEVNVWRPTNLNRKKGDVQLWLDHIAYFYEPEDVEHVLNWLAHALQKPHIKPGHAVVFGSKYEGIGKDLWLHPVRAAFGDHNVSEVGSEALSSQFNEWLAFKHLVILQEMWTGSRRELSNQLKPMLSSPPDKIMINEKGIARYPVPNVCATIMLTNHKDAISVAREDRRYFVMWSDKPPKSGDYYPTFASWVSNPENQSYIYDYLLSHDISKFNMKAPPPLTAAKTAMVEATMTRAENIVAVVKDFLEEYPINEIVAMSEIRRKLKDVYPDVEREVSKTAPSHANYAIKLALQQIGYAFFRSVRVWEKDGGTNESVQKRYYVFVKEGKEEKYKDLDPKKIGELIRFPFSNTHTDVDF